ncbi:substrate-binding periplasmic protein [Vibrio sp. NH-7]|uniref:substrate-binding periplasmic protein n=1 Tax=Vibrio sp. 16 TaxID=391586 RepID=UPI003FCE2CD7
MPVRVSMKRLTHILISLVYFSSFYLSASSTLQLVTLEYPPYIEHRNDKISGVAVELVKEVFAELKQPISIQVLPWARALNNIQHGRSDAIFTAFKNQEREQFADYSQQVLFTQNISLITLIDSELSSIDFFQRDLSSLSICVVNRVSYGKRMDDLLETGVFKVIFKRNKTEDCAYLVRAKRADVWVNNEFGARSIMARSGLDQSLKILVPSLEATPSYIAFSKLRQHHDLKNEFDAELAAMKRDGRYQALIERYFDSLRVEPSGE